MVSVLTADNFVAELPENSVRGLVAKELFVSPDKHLERPEQTTGRSSLGILLDCFAQVGKNWRDWVNRYVRCLTKAGQNAMLALRPSVLLAHDPGCRLGAQALQIGCI